MRARIPWQIILGSVLVWLLLAAGVGLILAAATHAFGAPPTRPSSPALLDTDSIAREQAESSPTTSSTTSPSGSDPCSWIIVLVAISALSAGVGIGQTIERGRS